MFTDYHLVHLVAQILSYRSEVLVEKGLTLVVWYNPCRDCPWELRICTEPGEKFGGSRLFLAFMYCH
jgi:hypothetical protein